MKEGGGSRVDSTMNITLEHEPSEKDVATSTADIGVDAPAASRNADKVSNDVRSGEEEPSSEMSVEKLVERREVGSGGGGSREIPARRRGIIAAVAVVLVIGAAAYGLWTWQQQRLTSGAGRPVPAPRSITLDAGSAPANQSPTGPADMMLVLAPETAARANLQLEVVGEGLTAEGGQLATGVVQPNAYRETPLVSLVGGIVRRVNGELGQNVRRGQPLVVVFSDDLAGAQSRYLTAAAELDEHHQHHRRTIQLLEIGAASREEFEQATSRLKAAESTVAAERQRLLYLGLTAEQVGALKSSTQISSEITLPAPASGVVVSRTVNTGEVIEANKELLRVADFSTVWVIGQVFERDMARLRVGSGASITTAAYPERVFRGRVAYVDPRLDPTTRTAQVRIELNNPALILKIGMFVNILFGSTGGTAEQTRASVPVAAVQNINNQPTVFAATKDANIFTLKPLRLGPEANGRYPVLEGLNVGERIVTTGSFLLRAELNKSRK